MDALTNADDLTCNVHEWHSQEGVKKKPMSGGGTIETGVYKYAGLTRPVSCHWVDGRRYWKAHVKVKGAIHNVNKGRIKKQCAEDRARANKLVLPFKVGN